MVAPVTVLAFLWRRRVAGVFRVLVFLRRPVFREFTRVFTAALVASIILI